MTAPITPDERASGVTTAVVEGRVVVMEYERSTTSRVCSTRSTPPSSSPTAARTRSRGRSSPPPATPTPMSRPHISRWWAGAWVVEHNYLQYRFPTWPAALDHANRLAEEEA